MPSPFAPLVAFLTGQPPATTMVTLTLAEIEQVLGRPLPAGAWARGWWQGVRYGERPRPWVAAGWRVAQVLMRQQPPTVTFVRVSADSTASLLARRRP